MTYLLVAFCSKCSVNRILLTFHVICGPNRKEATPINLCSCNTALYALNRATKQAVCKVVPTECKSWQSLKVSSAQKAWWMKMLAPSLYHIKRVLSAKAPTVWSLANAGAEKSTLNSSNCKAFSSTCNAMLHFLATCGDSLVVDMNGDWGLQLPS